MKPEKISYLPLKIAMFSYLLYNVRFSTYTTEELLILIQAPDWMGKIGRPYWKKSFGPHKTTTTTRTLPSPLYACSLYLGMSFSPYLSTPRAFIHASFQ